MSRARRIPFMVFSPIGRCIGPGRATAASSMVRGLPTHFVGSSVRRWTVALRTRSKTATTSESEPARRLANWSAPHPVRRCALPSFRLRARGACTLVPPGTGSWTTSSGRSAKVERSRRGSPLGTPFRRERARASSRRSRTSLPSCKGRFPASITVAEPLAAFGDRSIPPDWRSQIEGRRQVGILGNARGQVQRSTARPGCRASAALGGAVVRRLRELREAVHGHASGDGDMGPR